MKVQVNEGCIGCQLCNSTCPEVFQMNDDGLSEVVQQVDESTLQAVMQAAEGCPVNVIQVTTN